MASPQSSSHNPLILSSFNPFISSSLNLLILSSLHLFPACKLSTYFRIRYCNLPCIYDVNIYTIIIYSPLLIEIGVVTISIRESIKEKIGFCINEFLRFIQLFCIKNGRVLCKGNHIVAKWMNILLEWYIRNFCIV